MVSSGDVEAETLRRTVAFNHTENFGSWPTPKMILSPDPQVFLAATARD